MDWTEDGWEKAVLVLVVGVGVSQRELGGGLGTDNGGVAPLKDKRVRLLPSSRVVGRQGLKTTRSENGDEVGESII